LGQENGRSRRVERLGGLPGVSQLIVVAVVAKKKSYHKRKKYSFRAPFNDVMVI